MGIILPSEYTEVQVLKTLGFTPLDATEKVDAVDGHTKAFVNLTFKARIAHASRRPNDGASDIRSKKRQVRSYLLTRASILKMMRDPIGG